MQDGGWSLYDHGLAVAEVEAIIKTVMQLDEWFVEDGLVS